MAARLIWAESALRDLDGLAAYIAEDSPHYAALTVDRIVSAVEHLAEFPLVGRAVPEFDDLTLREVFWRQYRIIYKVEADIVAIVAVAHGARPLDAPLGG